jgi:hypothetical protein
VSASEDRKWSGLSGGVYHAVEHQEIGEKESSEIRTALDRIAWKSVMDIERS